MNVTKVDAYDVTVIDKLDWHNTKANCHKFFGEVRIGNDVVFQSGDYVYAYDAYAVANEWMLSTVNELVVN
jgi:hypothetical protein|tara:strand:- start:2893 stop:3105 length:213 start_codon:yes stop_codon:yes gene_type:complete